MRYLIDATPSLTILAAIGYWRVLRRTSAHRGAARVMQCVVNLVVILEAMGGVFIAVGRNPVLFRHAAVWFPVL